MSDSLPLQPASSGAGPLLERRYWIEFRSRKAPEAIMRFVQGHLADFCPRLLANFSKEEGREGVMRPGDEYHIHIFGPWNGDVRVLEVGPTFFRLGTLQGHPEAGEITFSLWAKAPDTLHFEIRSLARMRDPLVAAAYLVLGLGVRRRLGASSAAGCACSQVAKP